MDRGMRIGLIDVDGHNFPNLALMKISAWHRTRGDEVEFATMFEKYDVIYKSKVFSWTADDEYAYNTPKYISGGSGYEVDNKLDDEIDSICPDYTLYNCQHAYGFLTRGCIRKCPWCSVPRREGYIRAYADIDDFIGGMKTAVLMDNNVLACEHGIRQIEKIARLGIKVDFNQGIDARLIDESIAKLFSKVKWLSPVRLACDSENMMVPVKEAVEIMRIHNVTPKAYFCYVLVKDIDDALERVKFLVDLGVDPFAQSYRDGITEPTTEQKNFCRWVNLKKALYSCDWKDFRWKDRAAFTREMNYDRT